MVSDVVCHVLLVDDDKMLTDLVNKALGQNFHIITTNKGVEAPSLAKEKQPDLILLDIMLLDSTGYDICKLIKESPETQHIPVVFISSLTSFAEKAKAFEAGAVDYITKPIDLLELKMRIDTHLTKSHLQRKMEDIIRQRTDELDKSNVALHAMLKNREAEIRAIEKTMLARVEKRIIPYLNKLEKTTNKEQRTTYIKIIKRNLLEILPSNKMSLSAYYLKLTPTEIKTADLIRQGKQSKEIADQLNLSIKTVFFYRNSIRKKLGLLHRKTNLSTFLQSLDAQN